MPIYDYRCDHCGHVFSAVQSYSDATLEVCPNCGKKPRKLLVAPAVVFKGSGWYKTDSRPAAKDEGGGTAKKDETKKESKPDASTPSASPAPKSEGTSSKSEGSS
jgi:putative FmdB family regulatory protein